MSNIKRYLISIALSLGLILVFALFLNILNYFDLLNKGMYKAVLVLFLVISIFVGSYNLGNNSKEKGYLNGIYFGIIISILFIILSLLFKENISISSFIYYLIIVITSSIGGTIGINKKLLKLISSFIIYFHLLILEFSFLYFLHIQ